MKNKSKIAVIGGTGKSGRYLVHELLLRGYHFKILVRNPRKLAFESPLVEIVKGDINDYDTVKHLVKGCDVVMSTLGWGNPSSANTILAWQYKIFFVIWTVDNT